MTTLTYEDLVTIRSVLLERHEELAATLGRVEKMIEQVPRIPNAETLAAMEEAKNWRNLPSYESVDELMRALKEDD